MSQWRMMVVTLTALMAMPFEARAEDYPTHNVIILVPFAPGGGTDLLARAYAQVLEKKYNKTFVVESRRRHDACRDGHGQCDGGRLHADAGNQQHHGDEPHHFQASVL